MHCRCWARRVQITLCLGHPSLLQALVAEGLARATAPVVPTGPRALCPKGAAGVRGVGTDPAERIARVFQDSTSGNGS